MNLNQKQSVLDTLVIIQGTNVKQLLIDAYPTETDFSKINISKYNATEFLSFFNKMISQLVDEIEKGLGLLLPFAENYSNDFGAVNLQNDLSHIQSYLISNQFAAVEPVLDKLIHYQIKNGFWDKSSVKAHSIELEELKKQKTAIDLNQKALDKNIESYKLLKSSIDKTVDDFDSYIVTKKEQLAQISDNLTASASKLSEMNTIVASATNKDTEISGILKNLNEKLETITVDISDYLEEFENIKINNTDLTNQIESFLKQTSETQKKSKEEIDFITSKKDDIVRLTGMAADGSLGSKFEDRQIKISESLYFWKWAVPVATVFSLSWVIVVFTCLAVHTDNVWVNLLINLIKTTPVFILLGFVFRQYNKERNLQEEYAFKSSVAMTLTAYSEMLSKSDSDDNISRQQMLLKSIEMVYSQPHIHPVKSETLFSFNTKDLKETVGALTEAVKNVKEV